MEYSQKLRNGVLMAHRLNMKGDNGRSQVSLSVRRTNFRTFPVSWRDISGNFIHVLITVKIKLTHGLGLTKVPRLDRNLLWKLSDMSGKLTSASYFYGNSSSIAIELKAERHDGYNHYKLKGSSDQRHFLNTFRPDADSRTNQITWNNWNFSRFIAMSN